MAKGLQQGGRRSYVEPPKAWTGSVFQVQNRAEESSSSLLAPMRGPGPAWTLSWHEPGVGEAAGSLVTVDMNSPRSCIRVSVTNTRSSSRLRDSSVSLPERARGLCPGPNWASWPPIRPLLPARVSSAFDLDRSSCPACSCSSVGTAHETCFPGGPRARRRCTGGCWFSTQDWPRDQIDGGLLGSVACVKTEGCHTNSVLRGGCCSALEWPLGGWTDLMVVNGMFFEENSGLKSVAIHLRWCFPYGLAPCDSPARLARPPDDPCTWRSMRPPPHFRRVSSRRPPTTPSSTDRPTTTRLCARVPVARLQVPPSSVACASSASIASCAFAQPHAQPDTPVCASRQPTTSLCLPRAASAKVWDAGPTDRPRHRIPCRRRPFPTRPSAVREKARFANIASKRPSVRKPGLRQCPSIGGELERAKRCALFATPPRRPPSCRPPSTVLHSTSQHAQPTPNRRSFSPGD